MVVLILVDILKIVAKVGWLATSYVFIISFLTGMTGEFLVFFLPVSASVHIVRAVTSAMSVICYIFTPEITKILLYVWLLIPPVKLGFYFSHKIATFGDDYVGLASGETKGKKG